MYVDFSSPPMFPFKNKTIKTGNGKRKIENGKKTWKTKKERKERKTKVEKQITKKNQKWNFQRYLNKFNLKL